MEPRMKVFLVTVFVLSAAQAAPLDHQCKVDTDCQENAVCRPHRCDFYICQCKPGYVTNPWSEMCEKVSIIGEACNKSTDCLPLNSECNMSANTCDCKSGYQQASGGFWCIIVGRKALGESCLADSDCGAHRGTKCEKNICTCSDWHAPWGSDEKWFGLPASKYVFCENINSTVSDCNGVSYTPPIITQRPTPSNSVPPPLVGLRKKCTSDVNCPANSGCYLHGCDGKVCLCEPGYVPNPLTNTCEKGSLIGEACDGSVSCVPLHSRCNGTADLCECESGYQPTTDKLWCLKHKALGEPCTGTPTRECGLGATCKASKCECASGHQVWGKKEWWFGLPVSKYLQCENINNALNSCNGTTLEPPLP